MGLGQKNGRKSKTKYRILLHSAVLSEIKKLPPTTRSRAKEIIETLAVNPTPIGSQKLRGRMSAYRIRVGEYRIVYEVHVTEVVVYIVGIAHRREVYRQVLRRRTLH